MVNSIKSSNFAARFVGNHVLFCARMSEQNTIIIDLGRLEQGRHELNYTLDDAFFAGLDQDEVLSGNVNAKVLVNASVDTFQVRVELEGEVNVTCDRCLDPVAEPVQAEDDILIKLAKEDCEDDTCIYLNAEKPLFDLGWLFYEEISVNLPIVCRHQPGECNPEMEKLLQSHLCTTIEDDEE